MNPMQRIAVCLLNGMRDDGIVFWVVLGEQGAYNSPRLPTRLGLQDIYAKSL